MDRRFIHLIRLLPGDIVGVHLSLGELGGHIFPFQCAQNVYEPVHGWDAVHGCLPLGDPDFGLQALKLGEI